MNSIFKHTFVRFAIVGSAGFLVDLTSMLLLSIWLPHLVARSIAFWIAASSNWWWNRTITFTSTKPDNVDLSIKKTDISKNKKAAALQWMQFLGGSVITFIPNWGCYLILMSQPPENITLAVLWPYLAMVPGIIIGMVLNYMLSRFWVFSPAKL